MKKSLIDSLCDAVAMLFICNSWKSTGGYVNMIEIKTTQGRDRTAFPRSHKEDPLTLVWLFSSTVAEHFSL